MSDILKINVQPPIGSSKAASLGTFLGKYEIGTANLSAWQCIVNQGCVRDSALTETIKQTSSAIGTAAALTPLSAPVAVPVVGALSLFFGTWLLPILLAMLAGEIGLLHWANGSMAKSIRDDETGKNRQPDYSEIRFSLTNVSAKRRAWTEYLIFLWCANNGAKLSGAWHPDREAAAANAIARYGQGYYPKPWGEQRPGYVRKGKTARKAKRAKRGFMREVKSLW